MCVCVAELDMGKTPIVIVIVICKCVGLIYSVNVFIICSNTHSSYILVDKVNVKYSNLNENDEKDDENQQIKQL